MEPKEYLEKFFALQQLPVTGNGRQAFEDFCEITANLDTARQILEQQQQLMKDYSLKLRITDIINQRVSIPNGMVGKPYTASFDFEKLNWNDIITFEIEGLEGTGLQYLETDRSITGIPVQSGDFKIILKFRVKGELEDTGLNIKQLALIINPDPKSLWKTINSDQTDDFWKEDEVSVAKSLGDKYIVACSKRGRSHANVGSFRDDDMAFRHFEPSGWSIIAVSDGAGSAKYSRQGAKVACNSILDYFGAKLSQGQFAVLDELLHNHVKHSSDQHKADLNLFIYNNLGQASKNVYNQLVELANQIKIEVKDLHATLAFALVKKYDFGYVILSFGVGDCPIGLVYNNRESVQLMNTLDVGEYGGGTRFITMPEIFSEDKLAHRIGFKIVPDFDYLVFMTDGIYDPKFEVEANLAKPEKWRAFIDDLKGANPEGVTVNLDRDNPAIAAELSRWMDFWSPGNHDDRTLALLF